MLVSVAVYYNIVLPVISLVTKCQTKIQGYSITLIPSIFPQAWQLYNQSGVTLNIRQMKFRSLSWKHPSPAVDTQYFRRYTHQIECASEQQ